MNDFTRTSAATPCGVSLGTALAKTSSGSSSASVCDDSCGSSLCARSRAESLKKTVLQPQSAADGLFHQMHAFDGDLALLVGRGLGEGAAQFFHARVLPAVDAAQTSPPKLVRSSHGRGTGVYPTPQRRITARDGGDVIICSVAVCGAMC